jgi:SAM-dependent methyltransferase
MVNQSIGKLHHEFVFKRRFRALTEAIAPLLPAGPVLDLGSGNGMIAQAIMAKRDDITMTGVDVLLRPQTAIPTVHYDGQSLPFAANTFNAVMIVDVLHHTPDFRTVLQEALRVAPVVVVKDHFYGNPLEHAILRLLDWVGNASHGVALPYNYLTRPQWVAGLRGLAAQESHRQESVPGMYPVPFQWIIGRRIQFIARLTRSHHRISNRIE